MDASYAADAFDAHYPRSHGLIIISGGRDTAVRLATVDEGGRDGALAVVSSDGETFCIAAAVATSMQDALERWSAVAPDLRALADTLDCGTCASARQTADASLKAPLPRAWQWLDGSAFPSHGALMDQLLGITPEKTGRPLMYQGVSNHFYGPNDDVRMVSESDGIDFEGEFGVIVDAVPMGVDAADAIEHIRLVVQINDWSLRALAGPEMKTGFGWVQAKPPCSMAPYAVTPDALGEAWQDGRVFFDLAVDWNGQRFGLANGGAMEFGFHELVAHAARTRDLVAGTVIGSGTVSNADFRRVGSSCIAERRGIEIVDQGAARTEYMKFGDRVRMEGGPEAGGPFGVIDQRVVAA